MTLWHKRQCKNPAGEKLWIKGKRVSPCKQQKAKADSKNQKAESRKQKAERERHDLSGGLKPKSLQHLGLESLWYGDWDSGRLRPRFLQRLAYGKEEALVLSIFQKTTHPEREIIADQRIFSSDW